MAELNFQSLVRLSDEPVKQQVVEGFTQLVKSASSVRDTFFPGAEPPSVPVSDQDWVNRVAAALVCSSIGRSAFYSFDQTVNSAAARSYWENQLAWANESAIRASQALYDWAYPHYCATPDGDPAGKLRFEDYLRDKPLDWARKLADHLASEAYINMEVLKLDAHDPQAARILNSWLYKLHRLDSTQVDRVAAAWAQAVPDMKLEKEWHTYNFLTNAFRTDQFVPEVNEAIALEVETETKRHSTPIAKGVSRQSVIRTFTAGTWVRGFLDDVARNLGLTTGARPSGNSNTVEVGIDPALQEINFSSLDGSTLRDNDRIRVDVRANECDRSHIRIGLQLAGVTWWKMVALQNGDDPFSQMRLAECQDSQTRGVSDVGYQDFKPRNLYLWKAKELGIHSAKYWVHDAAVHMTAGNEYIFNWLQD